MKKYHKIQTIFKRDPATNFKTLLMGEYSLPEFEYLKDNEWIFTEKVDGTNIRVMCEGDRVSFEGKTDNAQIPAFLLKKLQDLFNIDTFKEIFDEPETVCLYGEGFGAKIQKGGGNYISDGVDFVLFDVKIGEWWLKREDVKDVSEKMNIQIVPIVGGGSLESMVNLAEEGFKSRWGNFDAEGIVARPKVELKTRSGQRIITKIKRKDFPK